MGIDSRENLETAVSLCGKAQANLSQKSADYASALMNEGNARLRLADMGIDSRENLETAVSLYEAAQEILSKNKRRFTLIALVNEGICKTKTCRDGH